jgi:hypothetical protein
MGTKLRPFSPLPNIAFEELFPKYRIHLVSEVGHGRIRWHIR